MKEIITLSMEEIHRLNILEQVEEGALSLISGTEVLKISYRHGKRLLARYRRDGPEGLAHKRRGRRAHNAFDPAIREHVIKLHQERYPKFNDTHFVEMLEEREGLGGWDRAETEAPSSTASKPAPSTSPDGSHAAMGWESP